MVADFKMIQACRSCHSKSLKKVLSLGEHYVSNFIEAETNPAPKVPLDLVLCDKSLGGCGLLQLEATTSPDLMYRQYWYRSAINQTMQKALADIVAKAEGLVQLNPGDIVLDIGCNDGTLLRSYSNPNLIRVGFEPSKNIALFAKEGTTKIINDFFSLKTFQKEFPQKKARIITSIAMFYDLDDPNQFVSGVAQCLEREGLWIIQMNYLPAMLEKNSYDNACHEHLEYYSLMSLKLLLQRHAIEIFDVELNEVNGGSFRIYIRHQGSKIQSRAQTLEEQERKLRLDDFDTYHQFANRALKLKEKLKSFIQSEKAKRKKIYVYGASTKGNTILQFCELHSGLIEKAADKNTDKWGKKTVGSCIPIISEEQARTEKPDYFLILPWHFLDEFIQREKDYLRGGGQFIVPIPEFRIIGAKDL